MQQLLLTSDVHPRERFDYWHEIARKNIVDHDSQPDNRPRFEAEVEAGVLADVGFIRCTLSPLTILRTAAHIARERTDNLLLCRLIGGTAAFEQEGREVVLEAGDFTVLDPMLPYSGTSPSGLDLLVIRLPRRDLEARIGNVRRMVARAVKPLAPETSLVSSFLAMLLAHVGKLSHVAEEVLKHQTIDLIALSLAKMVHSGTPRISSTRRLVLLKVRAAIEARLSDPVLDGQTVAAAAGVSVRYANAVLAEEGTSIARYIQERRLARCRRALEDSQQAHRSLSEIACGWGFSDMTHFGRSFRKAYGMLPSVYRKLAIRAASGSQ
jgi:AraC family transcriptional regulator, positive regulator of tynA and feaB